MPFLIITEEDGWKLKNIYIKTKCSFSLNLMIKIGKKCFKNVKWRVWNLSFSLNGNRKYLQDYCLYSISQTDASKKTVFIEKYASKHACLVIEKTQAVCCSHHKNIYFLLNDNKSFVVLCPCYCVFPLWQHWQSVRSVCSFRRISIRCMVVGW